MALAGAAFQRYDLILWLGIGAIAMRGAGCVYNDIVDRDLDARVARTRDRPLASGRVSLKAAWGFLAALCLVGLVVLFQFNPLAVGIAVASLVPVAAYPFMKRITWWPQAWLGIVFSWAALVAWPAVTGAIGLPALMLYAGGIAWVIGYDTIYALQDIEDDALAGIKSSARALGGRVHAGIATFYLAALLFLTVALWRVRPEPLAILALLPAAIHLGWQVASLRPEDPANALARFRANRLTGLLIFMACLVVGGSA